MRSVQLVIVLIVGLFLCGSIGGDTATITDEEMFALITADAAMNKLVADTKDTNTIMAMNVIESIASIHGAHIPKITDITAGVTKGEISVWDALKQIDMAINEATMHDSHHLLEQLRKQYANIGNIVNGRDDDDALEQIMLMTRTSDSMANTVDAMTGITKPVLLSFIMRMTLAKATHTRLISMINVGNALESSPLATYLKHQQASR